MGCGDGQQSHSAYFNLDKICLKSGECKDFSPASSRLFSEEEVGQVKPGMFHKMTESDAVAWCNQRQPSADNKPANWNPPTESAVIHESVRSSKLLQHDCDMTGGLTFEEIEDPPKSQTLCRARLKSEVDPVIAQTVINYVRSKGVFVCLGFYPESIMVTVGRFDNSEPPSPPFCAKDMLDAARGIYSYCVIHEWVERNSGIGSILDD